MSAAPRVDLQTGAQTGKAGLRAGQAASPRAASETNAHGDDKAGLCASQATGPRAEPKTGLVLAFDFGLRRIGAAVGDLESGVVSALGVVRAAGGAPDWRALGALVTTWAPAGIVVGQPVVAAQTTLARQTDAFVRGLRRRFALPVFGVAEAYTTVEARLRRAERAPLGRSSARAAGRRTRGGARKRRHKNGRAPLDGEAAVVILEEWLNARGAATRKRA